MSNELSTPKVLFCPGDTDRSPICGNELPTSAIPISAFFVGIDAAETNPQNILSADRNITNGTPVRNGNTRTDHNSTCGLDSRNAHQGWHVALSDGSVQQLSMSGLRSNSGKRRLCHQPPANADPQPIKSV